MSRGRWGGPGESCVSRFTLLQFNLFFLTSRHWKETAMPISIRPLHPVFAGEVAGIDCRQPLSPEEVAAIEAGMDQYALLVFHAQDVSDEEQIAFTRHFGELESYSTPGHIRRREEQRLGPGMADFS